MVKQEDDDDKFPIALDGSDIFLEIFSQDFCRITQAINMKRRMRGRDDMYQNKLKAIDLKVQTLETYNKSSPLKSSIAKGPNNYQVGEDGVQVGVGVIGSNEKSKLSLKKHLKGPNQQSISMISPQNGKSVGFKRSPSKESMASIMAGAEASHAEVADHHVGAHHDSTSYHAATHMPKPRQTDQNKLKTKEEVLA